MVLVVRYVPFAGVGCGSLPGGRGSASEALICTTATCLESSMIRWRTWIDQKEVSGRVSQAAVLRLYLEGVFDPFGGDAGP